MRKKNKLKSENGSAMVLAIIVIVLASLTMLILTKQVINQINLTHKTNTSIDKDYVKQGNVERGIGDFISKISVKDIEGSHKIPTANYKAPKGIIYRAIRVAKAQVLEAQVINNSKTMTKGRIDGTDTIKNSIDKTLGENLKYIESRIANLEGIAIKNPYEYYYSHMSDSDYIKNIINNKDEMKDDISKIESKLEYMLKYEDYKNNSKLTEKSKEDIKQSLLETYKIIKYIEYDLDNLPYKDLTSTLTNGKSNLDNSINDLENDINLSLGYLKFMENNVDFDKSNFKYGDIVKFIDYTIDLLNQTKDDLEDLRKTVRNMEDESYAENQRSTIIIAIRMNSLYHEIGLYDFEKKSMDIFNSGLLKTDSRIYKQYGNKKSEYLLKTYAQGLRRSLKETQVQAKFIQYQICKYFLNEYIGYGSYWYMADGKIIDNISNITKDLKSKLDYDLIDIDLKKEVFLSLDNLIESIKKLKRTDFFYWTDLSRYENYDETIKNSIPKFDKSVEELSIMNKELLKIIDSNPSQVDSKIENVYNASEEAINSLRKLRLIFNSVYSEGPKTPENIPDDGKKKITYADRNMIPNIKVIDIKSNGIDIYGTQRTEGSLYYIDVNKYSNVDFTIDAYGAKVLVQLGNIKDEKNYRISYKILEW